MSDRQPYELLIAQGWEWMEDAPAHYIDRIIRHYRINQPFAKFCTGEPQYSDPRELGIYRKHGGSRVAVTNMPTNSPDYEPVLS